MKTQLNARISPATREKLDELTSAYGTQAEVLAVAIDRLYQSHQAIALLDDITKARSDQDQHTAADRAIAALQALPEHEQERIAKEELIRYREWLATR